MIVKNKLLTCGIFFLCLSSQLSANITTLQSWDPIPFFNAANLNMPPDTQFCYGVKNRMLNTSQDKARRWGMNISPFVQKAIRAQQADNVYFGISGQYQTIATVGPGFQMGDYQGTAYLMGLFLGQDTAGNSIWGGPNAVDTGITTDITAITVANTLLPKNLQNAVIALNDIINETPPPSTTPPYDVTAPGPGAILFNNPSNIANTAPSILSQSVLQQDVMFFGAFSMPLAYQKSGFRWEVNFDFSDNIGFVARGGFCQITQRAAPPIDLSTQNTQLNGLPGIYTQLNTVGNADINTGSGGGIPVAQAQSTYLAWVSNNIDNLLDPTNGANYDITTFSQCGIEDVQLLGFFRYPFLLEPNDTTKYASMIVTPYGMFGGTIPISGVREYSKLYALPFGNNGHPSFGGVLGVTFDFMQSIEFGFEFGATGFLEQTINDLPCPNHQLQRVLYPYTQNVRYQPGTNGQFAAVLNAYHFMRNTTFSFRYNYVQHARDTITLLTPSQYFFPNYLENLTPWSSQMFIAALTFEIQPAIYLSVAWQGALSQRNAYCSNTILGSLNFQF